MGESVFSGSTVSDFCENFPNKWVVASHAPSWACLDLWSILNVAAQDPFPKVIMTLRNAIANSLCFVMFFICNATPSHTPTVELVPFISCEKCHGPVDPLTPPFRRYLRTGCGVIVRINKCKSRCSITDPAEGREISLRVRKMFGKLTEWEVMFNIEVFSDTPVMGPSRYALFIHSL